MQDRRLLYRQFQEAFPIEGLKDMTLDEYTNPDKGSHFKEIFKTELYECLMSKKSDKDLYVFYDELLK